MFASKSLTVHMIRGVVGMGSLALSVLLAPQLPLASLALVPFALVALRGCPACWTIGLVQTVIAKLRGTSSAARCSEGDCVAPRRLRSASR